jgi:predicted ATPase
VREYDLRMFRAYGEFLEGWVTADGGALTNGLDGMRRGAESVREQNVLAFDGQIKIALSEAEARAGDLDRAIAALDDALATAERTGYRAFEAELRRARGEMLLRRDPADFALAEQALQAAVRIARQQGTRSFELRAALSLANLYQSTDRPVEAHAVLAPAVDGFAPTPEMPEIKGPSALEIPSRNPARRPLRSVDRGGGPAGVRAGVRIAVLSHLGGNECGMGARSSS